MSAGRAIGLLLAALLFGVVGYLAYEGWQQVLQGPPGNAEVERVDVEASLQRDGAVAVRTTYHFRRPVQEFGVFVPSGGESARINGQPSASDIHADWRGAATATVVAEWDVRGRTKRLGDRALVEWPLAQSLIGVVGPEGAIDVRGVLYARGTADDVASNLGDEQRALTPGAVLLSGRTTAWSDVDAAVLVDAAAVPGAPVDDRGSAAAFAAARSSLTSKRPASDPAGQRTMELVATILLTGFGLLFFALYLLRVLRSVGQVVGTKARGLGERESPPDGDLPPSLVGVATGAAGRGERSLVAATVLELAAKGAIEVDGVTSEAFVLRLGPDPADVTPSQRVVARALRAEAGAPPTAAAVELHGPPLWSTRKPPALRPYRRELLGEARKAGLVSSVFSGLSLFVMAIVCGVLGAMATQSALAILLATLGPWVAIVAVALSGTALTKKGRLVRSQGEEYARYLRKTTELGEVGAPGVVLWGETLAYAAVLGAAPKTAEALSPRLSHRG